MGTVKFPKNEMRELTSMDKGESYEKYTVVDVGDWEEDYGGKYSTQEIVFSHADYPDKFFSFSISRTGSYYTDWYYDYEDWKDEVEADEVKKVEVVKYEWERV